MRELKENVQFSTNKSPNLRNGARFDQGYQKWSPRGDGPGLEAPRGQLVMSLVLALALVAKSLALASENM